MLRGRREHGEEPYRVGAVLFDQGLGIDGIALGLGHLGPVFEHHALGQEPGEGLVVPEEPGIAHEPMEEARIEEMQDGVLDPADVLVDREPVIDPCIEHAPGLVGRAVAGVIPGRLEEGVEGVGLALRLAAAGRAARPIELRHALQGRGHALEGHRPPARPPADRPPAPAPPRRWGSG